MRIATCVSLLICGCCQNLGGAQPARSGYADTSGYAHAGEYAHDLERGSVAVRRQAVVSLGNVKDASVVPLLIGALGDPEQIVRREAARALGSIKDPRAVGPLVDSLADGDSNVRFFAAYALGEIRDPKAAGPLLDALDDPQWCVRDQAAWALREIRDPKVAEPLVKSLKDQNSDVAHVAWLLRNLENAQTVDLLAALLAGTDAAARTRAVAVLGKLQDDRVIDPLVGALKDGDPNVRLSSVKALSKIGDDRARRPLEDLIAREQDRSVREAAERVVFQMSPRKHLMAHWSFDDGNPSVAKDVTGHGNDGEIRGCRPVEGKIGKALAFGRGRYVELGQPAGLPISAAPMTLTAWVQSNAPNGVVVARGGAFCGFSLYIKNGVAKFGIHRVQEGPGYIAAGREQITGTWVHLAGVVKNDRIELYVNGKLAATEKTPGYFPGNCGQGMEIGFDVSNSPAEITDPLEGRIDEVKVYQAALSAEEITQQFCRE